jgi:glyoxylase-like metal-dependent hydrolase (beta-lactamase superfamily II)
VLERIGILGEILPTPGNSADSVSLMIDDGSVITGDLTLPAFIGVEDPAVVLASWQLLRERGATRVYPGHGPIWPMDSVSFV